MAPIDGGFDTHPKVVKAGNAAVGLWARCHSWATRQLMDGIVPDDIVSLYGSPVQRRKLIDTGLWHDAPEQCDRCVVRPNAVTFHDWSQWNETRDRVVARRESAKKRQQKRRENLQDPRSGDSVTRDSRVTRVRGGAQAGTRVDSPVRSTGSHPDRWFTTAPLNSDLETPGSERTRGGAHTGAGARPGAVVLLVDSLQCTAPEARQVISAYATERKLRDPDSYVRRIIETGGADEFKRYLLRIRAEERKRAIEAEDRAMRKGAPNCPHGMAGGDRVNRITQKCRCGACDKIRLARELNGGAQ